MGFTHTHTDNDTLQKFKERADWNDHRIQKYKQQGDHSKLERLKGDYE